MHVHRLSHFYFIPLFLWLSYQMRDTHLGNNSLNKCLPWPEARTLHMWLSLSIYHFTISLQRVMFHVLAHLALISLAVIYFIFSPLLSVCSCACCCQGYQNWLASGKQNIIANQHPVLSPILHPATVLPSLYNPLNLSSQAWQEQENVPFW